MWWLKHPVEVGSFAHTIITFTMYKIIPIKRRYTPPFYAHTEKMLCLTSLLKYFHIFVVVRLSIFGVKNARAQSWIETQTKSIEIKVFKQSQWAWLVSLYLVSIGAKSISATLHELEKKNFEKNFFFAWNVLKHKVNH